MSAGEALLPPRRAEGHLVSSLPCLFSPQASTSTGPAATPIPASAVWTAWRRTSTLGTAAGPARRGWRATARTALTSRRWARSGGISHPGAARAVCAEDASSREEVDPPGPRTAWDSSHPEKRDAVPEDEACVSPGVVVCPCQPLLPWLQVHQHSARVPLRALSPWLSRQHRVWCGGGLCQGQQAGECSARGLSQVPVGSLDCRITQGGGGQLPGGRNGQSHPQGAAPGEHFSRTALRFAQISMNATMGTMGAATPTPSAPTRW